ncbi:unnamed protein product [Urochloa decumbens]|uniref:Strictosidine synthase conserved region domain-containing protein n=1 Tax=Urochloa decumbens TaxID=240449 RepID=A0ABC8XDE5_9POAL
MAAGLGLFFKAVALVLAPVVLAVALYSPQGFSPAPMPPEYSYGPDVTAPRHEARALERSERVGEGRLPGPEDLAYDAAGGWLYTGCADGWVRRVSVPGGDVEDWARTGGRPLGVVLAADGGLVVADADIVSSFTAPLFDSTIHNKFLVACHCRIWLDGRSDAVDIAGVAEGEPGEGGGAAYGRGGGGQVRADRRRGRRRRQHHLLHGRLVQVQPRQPHDRHPRGLEARPHGRLLSFDPATGRTAVLARDLYFANGVAMSPDQSSLIYCETVVRRCSRYHITGDKKGTVEKFIDNLPGVPDNIRYDGEGRYWIALSAGRTLQWDLLMKYPFVRKLVYLVEKFVAVPHGLKNSGTMSVTLDGYPVSMYTDPGLALTTGWLKVGRHLYYGSLTKTYLSRIDLTKFSADLNE